MSRRRVHIGLAIFAWALAACAHSTPPTFNVLSIESRGQKSPPERGEHPRDLVAYVEVVNPAARPIKLQKLQYTFASSGAQTPRGEMQLGERVVGAGAAVVVEVPILFGPRLPLAGETLTLAGRLWAEQDRIIRSFHVVAEAEAPPTAAH